MCFDRPTVMLLLLKIGFLKVTVFNLLSFNVSLSNSYSRDVSVLKLLDELL